MAHYQFEALHPFYDGNGRVGRLLVVMQLLSSEVLTEPTLSVSPWFEARRSEYDDRLFGVSTRGDWDQWIAFFSRGLGASAVATHQQMVQLLAVRADLLDRVERSTLRSATALKLVDLAVSRTSFRVKQAAVDLDVGCSRANTLIARLVDLEVLAPVLQGASYDRRFYAPAVNAVLLRG
jgi:Fic family protein